MAATLSPAEARSALRTIEPEAIEMGVRPSSFDGDDQTPTVAERRRRRQAGLPDPVGLASLMLNSDGVLFWHIGNGEEMRGGRRRSRRAARDVPDGEIVELYHFDKLESNSVHAFLEKQDRSLNANQGLRTVTLNGVGANALVTLSPAPAIGPKAQKRLLFIHGTFSKSEAFFDGFERVPGAHTSLGQLFGRYDEVLAFDHPTLSVSPVMNAFDLARLLAKAKGPLDVIAHSRGGLVARWSLEGYGLGSTGPNRAVLVGSPLNGTSLASPPRLRNALSLLSNIGTALKLGGAATVAYAPFLTVPLALVRLGSSLVSFAAQTPIVDGAVMMVAGLHGQSRIANHPELIRLRAIGLASAPQYFAVKSNFETADAGWKFWKWFRADSLLDRATDVVFPGRNDLVVDTESMDDIPTFTWPVKAVLDFGTTDVVHHTNYFAQKQTLEFILNSLK